jgi:flagellin
MGLRINTNIASVNAQRNLYNTTNSLQRSMEKLSSGLRINRAGDDAAGLAISEALKSDIRALEQASRNAADGISMLQTAEGALDEVSNIIVRLRELAEQSASETIGSDERGYLDGEFQALLAEITRISDTTEFNGKIMLDGTAGTLDVQVGIGTTSASQVSLDLSTDMDAAGLGLTASTVNIAGTDNTAALAAITNIVAATGTISAKRADFGAVQNRLEATIRNIGMSVENLKAANSRIRDVDVAAETSNFTALQILQQAGVSVLAQANQTSQLGILLLQR